MSANTICWTDIPITNLDRAMKFYSAVLGSAVKREEAPGFGAFGLLPHAENNVSGCLCETPDNKPSEVGPLVYLSVNGRLDDAIGKVEPNGGKVLMPKHAIGPYGFRAVIRDCEGNRIALHSETE
jgi:predicted enzyme related to lactoylglutathione lyase